MRAYAAALALLPLGLVGCSSGDSAGSADAAPTPTAASATPFFNPCRDLSAAAVGRALGAEVTRTTGTTDTPRCAFLPVRKGGPTLNVTYLEFDGDFADAFASMGELDGVTRDIDIAAADAARLVVNTRRKAVLVTGFVQVNGLIESVNAIGLAPYDKAAIVGATRQVMTTLVRRAP